MFNAHFGVIIFLTVLIFTFTDCSKKEQVVNPEVQNVREEFITSERNKENIAENTMVEKEQPREDVFEATYDEDDIEMDGNKISYLEFMESGLTGTVVIPDGIVGIEEGAFAYNSITRVVFPESLKYIDAGAFLRNHLKEIIIGSNVRISWNETPGSGAGPALGIYGASFFIIYHYNDKSAGEYIFNEMDGSWSYNGEKIVFLPREVIIPAGIYELGGTEYQWKMITNIYIPNGIVKLMQMVFVGNNLNKIVIPDTVRFISDGAFGHNPITQIKIGNNVEFIDAAIYPTFGQNSWSFQIAYVDNNRKAGTYIFDEEENIWNYTE